MEPTGLRAEAAGARPFGSWGDGREAPRQAGPAGFCRSDSPNPSAVPAGVVPTGEVPGTVCWAMLGWALPGTCPGVQTAWGSLCVGH